MALKVVCDGRDQGVGEAAVGVFGIVGVEGDAVVAEDFDAADAFHRAGRAAPERDAHPETADHACCDHADHVVDAVFPDRHAQGNGVNQTAVPLGMDNIARPDANRFAAGGIPVL